MSMSSYTLTPRARVERALAGGRGDRVPFTLYEGFVRPGAGERDLRNRGLCIVNRLPVWRTHRPHVRSTSHTWEENGRCYTRTQHDTPEGTLMTLTENVGFTLWRHELLLKQPEDYAAIRFLLRDEVYVPDYAPMAQAETEGAGDVICRANFGLEPLQELISGGIMRMEQFCEEWMERRDEVLSLYAILVENRRRIYPLVAASPAGHANYGGNVTPEIIGPRVFREYYLPHYHEAAEIMHRHGKRLGCHLDANNRIIAEAIAETPLDYIEAFTPAPDTDMTLAEARAAWPDKVLWINFPSSAHLQADADIEQLTVALVEEAGGVEGLLFGVTEDMPESRWPHSCQAIMSGLERHTRDFPAGYAPPLR
jgi:hypothetical protein